MENRTVYIYVLIDPFTSHVRYVGKTVNLQLRYNCHVHNREKKTRKGCWIKSLKNKDALPEMMVIDCINNDDWEFWERHYISLYKSYGYTLTNLTDGGEVGMKKGTKQSAEAREKRRAYLASVSKEEKQNWAKKANETKKLRADEYKERRKLRPKRVMGDAQRELLRQKMLNASVEYRAKISAGNKGKKFSEEFKKKLSEAHKNQANDNLMKPVLQLSLNGEYIKEHKGVALAARSVNGEKTGNAAISAAIKNNGTAYGYKWRYKGQTQMEIDNNKARNTMFEQNQKQSAELINNINTGSNV